MFVGNTRNTPELTARHGGTHLRLFREHRPTGVSDIDSRAPPIGFVPRASPKRLGTRRAAALSGSRALVLRYAQVEEDSRHDEPSPRRGRRDGISRGTRRGGPHAQRRGGGASRDLSRSRVWAHALPRARGLAPLAAGHRGGGREEDLVPVLPGPRGRGGGRGEPLGDARRAVVVRYDQARGPTVREELAVPGNRRVARVRASLAHAPDARARGAGVRRLVKDAHRAVLAPRARYAAARTTPRRRGDANVTPEERPEKPRADARRGRHGRANTQRKILTNLVRVSRL